MVIVVPGFVSDWLPGKIIVTVVTVVLLAFFVRAYFRNGRRL